MMPSGRSSRHPGRACFASLALVANLIAAGVPVLHAWAHEARAVAHAAGPEHAGAGPAAIAEKDHGHDAARVPAHGTDHERAPLTPAAAGHHHDHDHDATHPPALHEDCLLVHRAPPSLVFAAPAARPELLSFVAADPPAVHPVSPVPSRAPPSVDRARAPPLA